MRPHVELIQEDDYIWHGAELPGGEGRASERRLSVDEEDGSSSLRVDFHTDWGRGPGIHHADTEYYVLDGEIDYGGQKIGKGGYVYAPKGVPIDCLKVAEGTQLLHYREYGDAGFDPVDSVAGAARWADAREDVIVIDSEAMQWDAVPNAGPDARPVHQVPPRRPGDRLLHPAGARAGGLVRPPAGPPPLLRGGLHDPGPHGVQLRHPRPRHLLLPPGPGEARPLHDHGGRRHLAAALRRRARQLVHPERVGALGRRGRQLRPEGLDESPHPAARWSQSTHDMATAVAHRRGHAPDDRRRGSSRRTRASTTPRSRTTAHGAEPVGHRDRQGARRRQPAGRARRVTTTTTRTTTTTTTRTTTTTTTPGPRLGLDRSGTPSTPTSAPTSTPTTGAPVATWKEGDPIPAPILSSLPVRSRSRGRWDGDGM